MAKKKLGNKYVCHQCGCKFYDLGRPRAICPKCGADQNEAPTKQALVLPEAGVTAAALPRSRARRRRRDDDSIEPASPPSGVEIGVGSPLEDALSIIDDEELSSTGAKDYSGED